MSKPQRFDYIASAGGWDGRHLGTWRAPTVRGAMALADAEAHPRARVSVDAAYTSDGTFWGEGRGRVMARRDEGGRWIVESYADAPTETVKDHGAPWSRKNPSLALDKKQLARSIDRDRTAKLKALRGEVKAARERKRGAKAAAAARCRAERDRAAAARHAAREALARAKAALVAARGSCAAPEGLADLAAAVAKASNALAKEEEHVRAVRAADRAAKARMSKPGPSKAREKAGESDDEVRANIHPDLLGLFERLKRSIKGSARKSRTEEFLEYVEAHPDEAYADADDATDRMIAQHEAALRRANPGPGRLVALGVLVALRYKPKGGRAVTLRWADRGAPIVAHVDGENRGGLVIVYGARPTGSRAAPSSRATYRRTHWGLDGKGERLTGDVLAGKTGALGPALAITYATRKGDDCALVNYVHRFGDGAATFTPPTVEASTVAGRRMVRLAGGSYTVNARGIVG